MDLLPDVPREKLEELQRLRPGLVHHIYGYAGKPIVERYKRGRIPQRQVSDAIQRATEAVRPRIMRAFVDSPYDGLQMVAALWHTEWLGQDGRVTAKGLRHAAEDQLITIGEAEEWAEGLPDARLVTEYVENARRVMAEGPAPPVVKTSLLRRLLGRSAPS